MGLRDIRFVMFSKEIELIIISGATVVVQMQTICE